MSFEKEAGQPTARVTRWLHAFVAARFWIAPLYIFAYYGAISLGQSSAAQSWPTAVSWMIGAVFVILCAVLAVAVLANPLWILDYKSRLIGGVKYLRQHGPLRTDNAEAYDQLRWSNGKMLAVTTVIMAIFTQYDSFMNVPPLHRPPVIVVLLLVFVSLFDSALDLEAEWTLAALAASQKKRDDELGGSLAELIWSTNQFRPGQRQLHEILAGTRQDSELTSESFSATAKNLISFAIIIVSFVAAAGFASILLEWRRLGA